MSAAATMKRALRGPIAWMARNPVAANLLMVVILVGGILSAIGIKQEVFPEFELDVVVVDVPYPGASPEEVEQGIILAVEEAITGLEGIKRVTSTANEGRAQVTAELILGADPDAALDDINNAVGRITTFPEDAEEPTVSMATLKQQVISLVISGEQDDRALHALAEKARRQLLERDGITQVEIGGVRPLEVSIEVSREQLESYGLTLDQIAQQVRAASIELPGGGIDTRGGEVLLRTTDRRLTGEEFADIILRGTSEGARVRLGDIATITDGYADTDQASFYNGQPAVRVTAYRVGDETPSSVAAEVRDYADELRAELPASVAVSIWNDDSEVLTARIDLLVKNAWMGFALVMIILALFLRLRLAAWVALGIPISFLGAFSLMPLFGLSVNMVTLFALIVTLGLVVDDAIIVGENIHKKIEAGMPRLQGAILGTQEMLKPVTFSILTTIAAFGPLFFIPGVFGKVFFLIPAVVVSVLIFSWVESFFVLPAHLGHGAAQKSEDDEEEPSPEPERSSRTPERTNILSALPNAVSKAMDWQVEKLYKPAVRGSIRYRYGALGFAIAVLIVTISLLASGLLPFSFFPKLEGDLVTVTARLPYGAPIERTQAVRAELERSAEEALEQAGGQQLLRGIFTRVGEGPQNGAGFGETGSHLVTIEMALIPSEEREATAQQIADLWSQATPELAGLESLVFTSSFGPGAGAAVDVQLTHEDNEVLAQASEELTAALRGYSELTDVQSTWSDGKAQLDFSLLPEGRDLGLTSGEIARQLRAAFYGAEALREQRGRNELKVMVRLPDEQRQSELDLEQFRVRTPAGAFVPLDQVATFERGVSPTSIKRESSRRIVNVTASLAAGVASPREVLASLEGEFLPELQERHPGLGSAFVGEQREQGATFASLGQSYIFALFVIFALLAIPLRSYLHPLVIMAAIPFGIVGAVAGHLVMGFGLSIISVFGIIALSGVVVNDTLVLIVAANKRREEGADAREAILFGGVSRFRPIILTSLTTFFGLFPMILETSAQARFLIPMAISLGFGVLFATFIALVLVPALYIIAEDIRGLATLGSRARAALKKGSPAAPAAEEEPISEPRPTRQPAPACPPVC